MERKTCRCKIYEVNSTNTNRRNGRTILILYLSSGMISGGSAVTIHLQCRRCRFSLWVRKILWKKKWQPTAKFLPGKSHGQRSLAGYSPWIRKEKRVRHHWATNHVISAGVPFGGAPGPAECTVEPFLGSGWLDGAQAACTEMEVLAGTAEGSFLSP